MGSITLQLSEYPVMGSIWTNGWVYCASYHQRRYGSSNPARRGVRWRRQDSSNNWQFGSRRNCRSN